MMPNQLTTATTVTTAPADWRRIVARYQRSSPARAITQVVTTLLPLALVFYVMFRSLVLPYWITLLLAIPAAGLLVRTFIIMHDCAHGSFLPWRRVNDTIGFITGVLTMTPFGQWRRDHAIHHASSGDLDRRGHGDVNTLTVREYQALSKSAKWRYRCYRNPLSLLFVGPIHLLVGQRFRARDVASGPRQSRSVIWTNIAIAAAFTGLSLLVGFWHAFLIYFPAFYIAGMTGVWLFYMQHQFEDTYWQNHPGWDYATAAIAGSSHLRLPQPLQWFTGSIGLHHVHHLGPRIPNYKLQRCHDENPLFHEATEITMANTWTALRLALWDEDTGRLVRFSELPNLGE
jgi:omega-6 fatty acid desaturase (delta-12 desaturase)